MYVHHVDGAPQIIHMECSPIRRHADRPRTAHFDQVTPGAQFRTLADESPLSVVGDGSPAAATVQSFMDLDEAQELPEEPTRPVDSPAESYDSHLEAFRPVQAGVFFGVEKLKGEPTFNGFSLGAEPSTPSGDGPMKLGEARFVGVVGSAPKLLNVGSPLSFSTPKKTPAWTGRKASRCES